MPLSIPPLPPSPEWNDPQTPRIGIASVLLAIVLVAGLVGVVFWIHR